MNTLHTGNTALITGANSGVGFELTKRLLSQGWDVIALIRSDFPADEPLITRARDAGQLRIYNADLGDFASLRRALQAIKAREERIDVLFNNAAAMLGGLHFSPRGHEIHFETNTVVPYIILMELKPLLTQGALKTVINTSSNVLLMVKQFSLDLLDHPQKYKPFTGPYGASKLGLSLWTQALAPALLADGIEIRSVNPGANKSKMTNSAAFPQWLRLIRDLFFSHPSVGATRVYDVAFGKWQGSSGIFVNSGKATPVKFMQKGVSVLTYVDAIYEREFLMQ